MRETIRKKNGWDIVYPYWKRKMSFDGVKFEFHKYSFDKVFDIEFKQDIKKPKTRKLHSDSIIASDGRLIFVDYWLNAKGDMIITRIHTHR